MKIIISPAKKMNVDTDTLACRSTPALLKQTEQLLLWMRQLTIAQAKELWKCNDRIAEQNYRRFHEMDLSRNLTPAIIAYEGIQYQYMAPAVFGETEIDYLQEHLRILSGFYGVLRPLDGVVPYRLEMQAKASEAGDLYKFWGDRLYREVVYGEARARGRVKSRKAEDKGSFILNLASKEYSRCVEKYLTSEDTFLTVVFGEMTEGKVKQKGTLAKMARGEMVRYLAENSVEDPGQIKEFDRLGYQFSEGLSTESNYIFLKQAI